MFSRLRLIVLGFLVMATLPSMAQNTAKPWAYWWWPGSAVNKQDILVNLRSYAKAGFGGLHIIPIYGVKGEESKFIPYLSKEWLEILDYTVAEAGKLSLGIDMTVGTGWPFGGTQVNEQDAAKSFRLTPDGKGYDLEVLPTRQKVKRAAPGGEGWVVDHFSKTALANYFKPFEEAFSLKNYGIRAFYNDSYEAYGANWTPDFPTQFRIFRGYNIMDHLDVLAKNTAETDREKRIWSDYHETLSDLLYEHFTKSYVAFGKKFGKPVRNESHGSPANILDLYALSDIPESEFFGSKPYQIPLYRQDPEYEESRFGMPDASVLKLASSAAHITGKKLVSSETSTWLGNHFKVALSQIKPLIDESFTGGINHIFYHGLTYSPPAEPFPGWLFYASTNYNQNSHFWETLPELNAYIERCQKLLQESRSDNDILLYFPVYDLWHTPGRNNKLHLMDVHNIKSGGVFSEAFRSTISQLNNAGFTYDFVSDRQLKASKSEKKQVITEGGTAYRAVLVPPVDYISLEVMEKLVQWQQAGVPVIFAGKLPEYVNGFYEAEKRQSRMNTLLKNFSPTPPGALEKVLAAKTRQETIAQHGLTFIRKKTDDGHLYFIANQDTVFSKGPVTLASSAASVAFYDPLTGKTWLKDFRKSGNTVTTTLHLEPGQSIFIKTFDKKQPGTPGEELQLSEKIPLEGSWQIQFEKGEPFLPSGFRQERLTSWTASPDTLSTYFSGTASYLLNFHLDADKTDKAAKIDLGDVRETARVTLNGRELGTAWCIPFQLSVPKGVLKAGNNELKVEVTNLSANRIRYIDRQKIPWKKFYDINIVDIQYKPFDASGWEPVASGLLGPVSLRTER